MIDVHTAGLLQTIFRREGRSLLQYLGEARPWTKNDQKELLCRLHAIIHEDLEAQAALGRYLQRNRIGSPYLGPYPQAFTTLNFVSLDSLLPRLVESQRRSIAALEGDRTQIQEPTARGVVEGLLEVRGRHLKELQAMLPDAQPATVPDLDLQPQKVGS
jgi:hypothetical protein